MTSRTVLVGIDCAAQPERFGLAVACVSEDASHRMVWHRAWQGRRRESIADSVVAALGECGWSSSERLILGLDAPLGWPSKLGGALVDHQAGRRLPSDSNDLFRRVTDDFVYRTLGKRPLEVGADRIARAAVTALQVLDDIRSGTGLPLPVALSADDLVTRSSVALEVYPAAYLRAFELPSRMYKRSDQQAVREQIISGTIPEAPPSVQTAAALKPDVLDALLCILTTRLWLSGECLAPPSDFDPSVICREGWVWIPR